MAGANRTTLQHPKRSSHPINRVFAIYFGSKAQCEAFFANPDYQAIKARFFQRAVTGTTIFGVYDR